jgi:hypothetical protein
MALIFFRGKFKFYKNFEIAVSVYYFLAFTNHFINILFFKNSHWIGREYCFKGRLFKAAYISFMYVVFYYRLL